ncbi:sensor histidine kinase [Exiguobacterium sp. SH1S21]|uniref:sensor histidine kinase n=1 Tax=Exiguobacterium sp. SH1S21 TaxID=2510953 RepID=UPI001F490A65|nr:ATP-binding protein [Exiguobacterium sp. SH1S21]
MISFTIIFTLFSIIIISQVRLTLYSNADRELQTFTERFEQFANDPPNEEFERDPRGPNPRIIVIHWSEDGEILNESEIGTTLYENYLSRYTLDTSTLDDITNLVIDDTYYFRSLLVEDTSVGSYTQLLINTDAEQGILDNFTRLITWFAVIFILLSILASYVLSKRMMQPIIRSWNKQAEFVENASHELRTPLTIIQNKLELLLTKPDARITEQLEPIALSLSETRRLSKLTSDLLTLARADSAETQLNTQLVDLSHLLLEVCAPYEEIALSQDKVFLLTVNGKIHVSADPVRLHQLIVILLDNALKYTKSGDTISVMLTNRDYTPTISVSDTGIGIQDGHQEQIFERFYREDTARARDTGGTGLGLSIAKWIVDAHSGTIHVEANQPSGSIFTITL